MGGGKSSIGQMGEAAARRYRLFAGNQSNLTEAGSRPEVDEALAAWEAGRAEIAAINVNIEGFLAAIKALKDSIDPAALPGLENELKVLLATRRRHEADIIALAPTLGQYQTRREAIAKEKGEVQIGRAHV